MAVIVPGPGDFAAVYAELLELVGSPYEIRSTSDTPTLGLIVAEDVYERWVGSEEPAPVAKRRGRPPKNPAPGPVESSPVDEETSP